MTQYVFDNTLEPERARLASLQALLDAGTFQSFAALDDGRGWRCWEVGGGGGSVAAWLCEHVGRDGYVLATDLETTLLETFSTRTSKYAVTTSWPTLCPRDSST